MHILGFKDWEAIIRTVEHYLGQDQKNITLIFNIYYSRKRKGVYNKDISKNEEEEEEEEELVLNWVLYI